MARIDLSPHSGLLLRPGKRVEENTWDQHVTGTATCYTHSEVTAPPRPDTHRHEPYDGRPQEQAQEPSIQTI